MTLLRRSSVALLSATGALALVLAVAVPMTPAHAGRLVQDDCIGTCPGDPEGPDISDPGPETPESESASEGADGSGVPESEPPESDTGSESNEG